MIEVNRTGRKDFITEIEYPGLRNDVGGIQFNKIFLSLFMFLHFFYHSENSNIDIVIVLKFIFLEDGFLCETQTFE